MKTFLSEVIDQIVLNEESLDNTILILPSKRAGAFAKQSFLDVLSKTSFAPTIFSIEDFVSAIAGLHYITDTELLFLFYDVYLKVCKDKVADTFGDFLKWAPQLLQDFNEIDRHLIDVKSLFSHLSAIQDINHWALSSEKTEIQKNYLAFWEHLLIYYQTLNETLIKKGNGYQGLVYREAVENIEYYISNNTNSSFYFIGFNALNKAEEHIIQEILEQTSSEIFWDTDNFFLKDEIHDAGYFIKKHINSWKYFKKNKVKWRSDHFTEHKNITIIGAPKNLSQANYTGKILKELASQKQELNSTAVVLGDEGLLDPLCYAIPQSINQVNITMGVSLKNSPFASFYQILFRLYTHSNPLKGWYHKDLFPLLAHPLTSKLVDPESNGLGRFMEYIRNNNLIYITDSIIKRQIEELSELLKPIKREDGAGEFIKLLIKTTFIFKDFFKREKDLNSLEYLFSFNKLFGELETLKSNFPFLLDILDLNTIYNQLIHTLSLDHMGNPMTGLQVMGVLESRNLDFETVIITSLNEGILPSGKITNSFIPFDLKKSFSLPTYKEKDAVYAYHFYRLLHRAKNIFLLYNTETDALHGGERSRFINQLINNKPGKHNITHTLVAPEAKVSPPFLFNLEKSKALIEDLRTLAKKGLSPSSITNYIRNPFDFYTQNVLGISQHSGIEEVMAANTLGTVVHNALEILYRPYIGVVLTVNQIDEILNRASEVVERTFKKIYRSEHYNKGKNLLVLKVAQRFVLKFIELEKKDVLSGNQIKILKLEASVETIIDLNGENIRLKGIADRLDERNGITRVIDYKTGKVTATELQIYDWSTFIEDYKYSKAFQVLCYVYLLRKNKLVNFPIQAGVISFRNMNAGFLSFAVKENSRSRNKNSMITEQILENFEISLREILSQLFDPEVPIIEKELTRG